MDELWTNLSKLVSKPRERDLSKVDNPDPPLSYSLAIAISKTALKAVKEVNAGPVASALQEHFNNVPADIRLSCLFVIDAIFSLEALQGNKTKDSSNTSSINNNNNDSSNSGGNKKGKEESTYITGAIALLLQPKLEGMFYRLRDSPYAIDAPLIRKMLVEWKMKGLFPEKDIDKWAIAAQCGDVIKPQKTVNPSSEADKIINKPPVVSSSTTTTNNNSVQQPQQQQQQRFSTSNNNNVLPPKPTNNFNTAVGNSTNTANNMNRSNNAPASVAAALVSSAVSSVKSASQQQQQPIQQQQQPSNANRSGWNRFINQPPPPPQQQQFQQQPPQQPIPHGYPPNQNMGTVRVGGVPTTNYNPNNVVVDPNKRGRFT
jgi:hypothetical protein